jgi:hypothetical protein
LSCNCVLFCFGERKYFGYIAGGRRKNGSASNLIRLFDRTVRAETPSTACATERRPRIVRRADYAHTMWHPSHRVSVSTITLLVSKWRSTRSLAFNYSFFRSMWVMSYTLQPEMREAATTHYDCTCFISSHFVNSWPPARDIENLLGHEKVSRPNCSGFQPQDYGIDIRYSKSSKPHEVSILEPYEFPDSDSSEVPVILLVSSYFAVLSCIYYSDGSIQSPEPFIQCFSSRVQPQGHHVYDKVHCRVL